MLVELFQEQEQKLSREYYEEVGHPYSLMHFESALKRKELIRLLKNKK